jgi:hypothetical protein
MNVTRSSILRRAHAGGGRWKGRGAEMAAWGKRAAVWGLLAAGLILPAGCSAGAAAGGATPAATRTRAPSRTATLSPTVAPTATEIPTVVPVVTASPGPRPDLELVNVTILNDMPWDFVFMAEMVNNTDEPMIFNEREVGLVLTFERWWEWAEIYHGYKEVRLRPLSSIYQSMNCILYPGEKGVVGFTSVAESPEKGQDLPNDEILSEYPAQQGTRLLGYQAIFRQWEDLRQQYPFNEPVKGYSDELFTGYHPAANNLQYSIIEGKIIFDFDVTIKLPKYGSNYDLSWLLLYDSLGRIINILFTRDIFCDETYCLGQEEYQIHGIGSNNRITSDMDGNTHWWKPLIEITDGQLERIDHIRVVNEIMNASICMNPLSAE